LRIEKRQGDKENFGLRIADFGLKKDKETRGLGDKENFGLRIADCGLKKTSRQGEFRIADCGFRIAD
jgi:hypothetical protein